VVTGFQGAIIAAGRGARLRKSGGATIPKPLVELGGRTLLARQAGAMLAVGASEVLAVINSETAALAARREFPRALRLIVRDTESSMESLFTLGEHLAPGHFMLATVDAVVPGDEFARFARAARQGTQEGKFDGMLGVVRWRGDRKPLFADIDEAGMIVGLGEKETPIVTAGIYWLSTAIFRSVARARARRLAAMRGFLGMLVEEGNRLGAFEVAGAIDIDEAADLDAARRGEEVRR
jgi:choline kinase